MKASKKLIEHIKKCEGLSLSAYQDAKGVWTIGYGHTGNVKSGDRITITAAETYLRRDMDEAERYVTASHLAKTQGQYDALVDFVYNAGVGNFKKSSLKRAIEAGADTKTIQGEFMRWVYSGGKKLTGLVNRRQWEATRWAERS